MDWITLALGFCTLVIMILTLVVCVELYERWQKIPYKFKDPLEWIVFGVPILIIVSFVVGLMFMDKYLGN